MCCLLVATKRPDLETLQKIASSNRDGAGIAWYNDKGKCEYQKGFNDVNEVNAFLDLIKPPYAIHFRLASIGGKSELLTHPFEVSYESALKLNGECEKLLFHNGHIHDWEKLALAGGILEMEGDVSDTRALAAIIHSHKDNGRKFLSSLKNKFVLMNSEFRRFQLIGDFTEDDGIFYSNTFWKWRQGNHSYSSYHNILDAECVGGECWENEGGTVKTKSLTEESKELGFLASLSKKAKKKILKRLRKLETPYLHKEIKETCPLCKCELPEYRVNLLNQLGYKGLDRVCYQCEKIFTEEERNPQKNNETDKRIHEQPDSNFQPGFAMSDSTKKILGIPIGSDKNMNFR